MIVLAITLAVIAFILTLLLMLGWYRNQLIYKYSCHANRHWHRHYIYISDVLKSQIGIIDTSDFYVLLNVSSKFHEIFKQQVPSYLDMYKNWKCWSYRSLTGTYERDIRRLSKFIIGQLVLTIQNQ